MWGVSVSWFFLLIDNSGGQLVKSFGLRAPFRKACEGLLSVERRGGSKSVCRWMKAVDSARRLWSVSMCKSGRSAAQG